MVCVQVYAAPLKGGGRAVVLFNRHHPEYPLHAITVRWPMLGYEGSDLAVVRDLYARKDLGNHAGTANMAKSSEGPVLSSYH